MEGLGFKSNVSATMSGTWYQKAMCFHLFVIADENILSVRLGLVLFCCQSMVYTGHQPLSKIRISSFKQRNYLFFNFVSYETALHLIDSVGHG